MRRVSGHRLAVSVLAFLCALTICYAKDDPNAWDFGKVKEGEIVSHDFVLKNATQKILKIIGVNTSCGCTAAAVKNKTLQPGESALIEVKFNSSKYKGNVQQFAYVNTDNVDNSIIRFIIKANVVK